MDARRLTILQLLLTVVLTALLAGFLWEVARVQRVAQAEHVEFSPDGRWLLVAYFSGCVKVWDVSQDLPRLSVQEVLDEQSTHPPVRFAGPAEIVYAQVLDPYRTPSSRWKLWDLDTGRHTDLAQVPGTASGYHGLVAAAGVLVMAPDSAPSHVEVIDLRRPTLRKRVAVGRGTPLALSPDGQRLAVWGSSGCAVVELGSGTVAPLDGQGYRTASFSPDGRILLLCARMRTENAGKDLVRAYDVSNGTLLWEVAPGPFLLAWPGPEANLLRLTADGQQVAVARWDEVVLYAVSTQRRAATVRVGPPSSRPPWSMSVWWDSLGAHHSAPSPRALSPDGRRYARVSQEREFTLADLASGTTQTLIILGPRWGHVLFFVVCFVAWSVAWAIVERRKRRRLGEPSIAALLAATGRDAVSTGAEPRRTDFLTEMAVEFAWWLMMVSGVYLIVRTVVGMLMGWDIWLQAGLPAAFGLALVPLAVGLFCFTRGAAESPRRLLLVPLLQLVCGLLNSGLPIVLSGAILLLLLPAYIRVDKCLKRDVRGSRSGSRPDDVGRRA